MTELATHSVTRDDAQDARRGGGALLFNVWQPLYGYTALPPSLDGAWSSQQDATLSGTIRHEAMWASAINKAITKVASLGWTISDSDDSSRRVERVQELLLRANGQQGYQGQYQNQAYGDLKFRCTVDYRGYVSDVRVERNEQYRRY